MTRAFFLGCNALGDTLCTTPVVRAYRKAHPTCFITYIVHNAAYCRVLDANPDIDLVLYNERLWMHGPGTVSIEWLQSLPLGINESAPVYHFDMSAVCAKAASFRDHISIGFSRLLGIPTDTVRPVVRLTAAERKAGRAFAGRPYAIFSMHSNANPPLPDGSGAKDWPMKNWRLLAEHIRTRLGWEVIAIGAEQDRRQPWIRNLYGLPIKVVAALLAGADCVITLENGLAHLAAAVDAPAVIIYSKIVPLPWAYPREATACEVIYADPRGVGCEQVLDAIGRVRAKSAHLMAPLALR